MTSGMLRRFINCRIFFILLLLNIHNLYRRCCVPQGLQAELKMAEEQLDEVCGLRDRLCDLVKDSTTKLDVKNKISGVDRSLRDIRKKLGNRQHILLVSVLIIRICTAQWTIVILGYVLRASVIPIPSFVLLDLILRLIPIFGLYYSTLISFYPD